AARAARVSGVLGPAPAGTGPRAGRGAPLAAGLGRVRGTSSVAGAAAFHHAGRLYLSRPHGPHAQVPARAAIAGGAGTRRGPDRGRSRVIATGGPAPSLPDGTALAFFPCHGHAEGGGPYAALVAGDLGLPPRGRRGRAPRT